MPVNDLLHLFLTDDMILVHEVVFDQAVVVHAYRSASHANCFKRSFLDIVCARDGDRRLRPLLLDARNKLRENPTKKSVALNMLFDDTEKLLRVRERGVREENSIIWIIHQPPEGVAL